ncbi:MAG TPA: toprim domain-containing protein [Steroidobacteraceae bacterium]|nr:toprim domain-containing protein [Steroidobacteraceae bacterium]
MLRAHPALEYWDGARSLGKYPAMVALFAGAAGAATTLHVTYLRCDGCAKAGVPSPKKILGVPVRGATRGGAIRLYEPRSGVLGVAEGIETALSLHLLCKIPTWAAFCADNIERVRLPERLRELRIAIDIDESGKGRASAEALAKRVRRWSPRTRVIYMVPELDGPGDLNDELRRRAG